MNMEVSTIEHQMVVVQGSPPKSSPTNLRQRKSKTKSEEERKAGSGSASLDLTDASNYFHLESNLN